MGMLVLPAYLKVILRNQIAIMENLNMQETDAYKKALMLKNAKNTEAQWEAVREEQS